MFFAALCYEHCVLLNYIPPHHLYSSPSWQAPFQTCLPLPTEPASKLSEVRKRKQSLKLPLWNLNSNSNSPVAPRRVSCQISTNQHEAEINANVNKHWKTRAEGNDVITNVISTNQHFAWTFLIQIFKFQTHSCKVSFLFPPCRQSA